MEKKFENKESQSGSSPQVDPETEQLIEQMKKFPIGNVKGAGSTQEYRCTPEEVRAVKIATSTMFGISEASAMIAISELIRRGGANAGTSDTFNVEIKCDTSNTVTVVSKRDISYLVARHANRKSMRNLSEGMAFAIVCYGVFLVTENPGLDRPGDLAKKIDNRLSFEKKKPLTPSERVGCASYAQWMPNLDELVKSNRIKSLLAQDLELRKAGSVQPQPKRDGGTKNTTEKKKKGGSK